MRISPLQWAQSRQAAYVDHRRRFPSFFGNSADGAMDGTPVTGPAFVFAPYRGEDGKHRIMTFWSVHKYAWPLQFVYFFGDPIDSRGERTDPDLCLDIRDLKDAIGCNRILQANWGSRSHSKVLTRALTHHGLAAKIADATLPF